MEKAGVGTMTILEGIPEIGTAVLLLLLFALHLSWFPAAGGETAYVTHSAGQRVMDVGRHLALLTENEAGPRVSFLDEFPDTVPSSRAVRVEPNRLPSAPAISGGICPECGHLMEPNGACEICPNCGKQGGCG